jgi:hypothetical protein
VATRDVRWAYEVLGLPLGAAPDEVRQKHRDLITVWHPDRFQNNPRLRDQANKKAQEINAAFALIRDLKQQRPSTPPTHTPPPQPPPTPPHAAAGSEQTKTSQTVPPPGPQSHDYPPGPTGLEVVGRGFFVVFGFGAMCLFGFDLITRLFARRLHFGWSVLRPIVGIVLFGFIGWQQLQALRRKHRWAWDRNR